MTSKELRDVSVSIDKKVYTGQKTRLSTETLIGYNAY